MFQLCERAPRSHTQLVLPMVKNCLSSKSLAVKDLDALAFGCGPGSFTGIRIAAGIAQGLAYGADVPIFAISNIKALALQSYLSNQVPFVLVAIDARMDEVYWAYCRVQESSEEGEIFYHVEALCDEQVSKPEDLSLPDSVLNDGFVGVGSGFTYHERFPSALTDCMSSYEHSAQPKADAVCELAKTALRRGESGKLEDALPSYVRNTVTWKKLPGRE